MSNLIPVLANANGRRASAWHKNLLSADTLCSSHRRLNAWSGLAGVMARAAKTAGVRSLILAILVLTTALTLSSAGFAAPVGSVGPTPNFKAVGGADPPISFNFNIGGFIGSGSVMSTNESGGNFFATSGTLNMASTNAGGLANKTFCLVPAAPPPGFSTSPLGVFLYDNVVTPGADPAFPTIYGLLFSNTQPPCVPTGGDTAQEINIWATNAPPGTAGHYSFYEYDTTAAAYTIAYDTPANMSDSFNATTVTTNYTYTGRAFNRFECLTGGTPDCANPGAGNPYATSNSVTASLQMAAPLCAPGSCSTAAINVACSPNFVAMTLNDGLNTISDTGANCNSGATAWVTTDGNGNINAWYLDATDSGNKDIHSLYDPNGVIANACHCYSYPNSNPSNEQDYGQFSLPANALLVYGYNLHAHGSFTPAYTGGTTTAGDCGDGQSCTLVPGNTFTIEGPNAGAIPDGAILTEQECVVPADPRGANCGAVNGHQPRSLNVSDLPQCKGFGNEVIPDHLCGASGASGTGFALILGNAEQIDTFNGTYGDSELDVEKVPGLQGAALNPTCPKQPLLPGVPSALAAVGTRSGSLVEEQTPEQTLDGRPLLIEMTSSCDPPKSNHGPGLTLEGVGFKLRTKDPAVRNGLSDAQSLLVLANYKFLNLDAVMLLTKFTSSTTRKNLQNCINKSQTLLNSGPSHYSCSAEQVYRCEQIVEGTDFNVFGPTKGPFLRLPDPYGDVVRRLGNLFYTINTRIGGAAPNSDWPLPADPNTHLVVDPYPTCP